MTPTDIQINSPTPWGLVDTVTYVADGITFVSTPSHGGFHLSPERLRLVPKEWLAVRRGETEATSSPWFEEDCDANMVVLTYPGLFSSDQRDLAEEMRTMWLFPKLGWAA